MEALLSAPVLDFLASASDRTILAVVVVAELYELSRAHRAFRTIIERKDAQISLLFEALERKNDALAAVADEMAAMSQRVEELGNLLISS